ncbi:MAG: filamentation induced by cAMP/death on curing-related protein, partial [Rhodospirillales bacterium]|nr:filamentation induced by cAMP/death on curing-related protein [Rhodospirillales bacterium]
MVAHRWAIVAHKLNAQQECSLAKQIFQDELAAIEQALLSHPDGASAQQILHALALPIPLRTLQYRLKYLVTHGRLVMDGDGRWARYRLPAPTSQTEGAAPAAAEADESVVP